MTCHLTHRPHRCGPDCLRVAVEALANVDRLTARPTEPVRVVWPSDPEWRGVA